LWVKDKERGREEDKGKTFPLPKRKRVVGKNIYKGRGHREKYVVGEGEKKRGLLKGAKRNGGGKKKGGLPSDCAYGRKNK